MWYPLQTEWEEIKRMKEIKTKLPEIYTRFFHKFGLMHSFLFNQDIISTRQLKKQSGA